MPADLERATCGSASSDIERFDARGGAASRSIARCTSADLDLGLERKTRDAPRPDHRADLGRRWRRGHRRRAARGRRPRTRPCSDGRSCAGDHPAGARPRDCRTRSWRTPSACPAACSSRSRRRRDDATLWARARRSGRFARCGGGARDPSQEAVVFTDERVSYGALKARADAFALGLLDLGIRPGDHVVLWMPNRVEWNVANLGIAKVGGVTVTCNSRYKAFEVEYVLRQSDGQALILARPLRRRRASTIIGILRRDLPRSRPAWRPARERTAAPRSGHVVVLGDHGPGRLPVLGRASERAGSFEPVPRPSTGRHRGAARMTPAAMLYTSGHHGRAEGLPPLARQHLLQVPRVPGPPRLDGATTATSCRCRTSTSSAPWAASRPTASRDPPRW